MEILQYTEKHQQFRKKLRAFCQTEVIPYIDQWERDGIVPKEVWRKMGREGFINLMEKLQQERLLVAILAKTMAEIILEWTLEYLRKSGVNILWLTVSSLLTAFCISGN